MAERILIAEDDGRLEFVLREALVRRGYEVDVAPRASAMIERLAAFTYDVILLAAKLPDMGRFDPLSKCRELAPDTPVIVVAPPGARPVALEAIRRGAYDFFTTPLQMREFEIVIARALERRHLQRQVKALRPHAASPFEDIVGQSDALRRSLDLALGAAATDLAVLIEGEAGTGRELFARAIHRQSARRDGPLVLMSMAATPEDILEARLFGQERSALSGAVQAPAGRFELAHCGTLVLGEIDELPPAIQPKLLRALEEHRIARVGAARPTEVDVRVIGIARQRLDVLVDEGKFCRELFRHLQQVRLPLPALRERIDDLPLLLAHLLERAGRWASGPPPTVSPEAMQCLSRHAWPGNVAELWQVLQAAIALSDGVIRPEHLPPAMQCCARPHARGSALASFGGGSLDEVLAEDERRMIVAALQSAGGIQARAAKRLGISERSLWYRVKKLGISTRPERVDSRR